MTATERSEPRYAGVRGTFATGWLYCRYRGCWWQTPFGVPGSSPLTELLHHSLDQHGVKPGARVLS